MTGGTVPCGPTVVSDPPVVVLEPPTDDVVLP
jgi:hypothetical protein